MKLLSLSLTLIMGLVLGAQMTSCAKGSKPYRNLERKWQDKMWRPCQDRETKSPVGKLCNRVCKKRKGKKCKKWKVNVKNFSDPKTFQAFRSAGFIFIDEDTFLQ